MMFILSPKDIEIRILNDARESTGLLPSCMVSRQFNCEGCSLSERDLCVLQQDTDFLSLLRWKVSNLSKLVDYDTSDDLVISIIEVFESQGSALHVDKVLGLLLRQKPQLKINLSQIKKALKSNPEIFQEKDDNVYFLNRDEEGTQVSGIEEG